MASAAATKAAEPRPSDQELVAKYQSNRQTLQTLMSKMGDMERDADEHKLVLDTLQETMAVDPARKCFRMIDNVLVERTVKDVLPALESDHQRLKEALSNIAETYAAKEKDQNEFIKRYNIQIRQ